MDKEYNEQLNWFEDYKKRFDYQLTNQPLNIYKYLYQILESKESGNLTYVNLGDFYYDEYIEFLSEKLDLINEKLEELNLTKEIIKISDFYKKKVEKIINDFRETKQKEPEAKGDIKKDKTKEYWFIVGVKFATGEMQDLLKNDNPTQIAIKLGNKNLRPFISQTNGIIKDKDKPDDKNIYKRKKTDIELILNYCKENNLNVCPDFKDKIKHIITD